MAYVIAYNLRNHYLNSVEEGHTWYRKYFFETDRFLQFKEETDAYLVKWGVSGCIVTE